MCTVSWIREGHGYQLLCNRDEKRTRARALPPEVRVHDGVRFVAPSDGDFGGTWIVANEFGLSVCLLNGPPARRHPQLSRGLVAMHLAVSRGLSDARGRIETMALEPFAPFTIALLDRSGVAVIEWNGAALRDGNTGSGMLTSSSFEPEAVHRARLAAFGRARGFEFHASHAPVAGPHSVCMHRDDAETVSFSWISVNPEAVDFFYTPEAPCKWAAGERVALAVRQ